MGGAADTADKAMARDRDEVLGGVCKTAGTVWTKANFGSRDGKRVADQSAASCAVREPRSTDEVTETPGR